jgi:predicted DNA binding protein
MPLIYLLHSALFRHGDNFISTFDHLGLSNFESYKKIYVMPEIYLNLSDHKEVILNVKIKDEIGSACNMHGRADKCIKNFSLKP